MSRIIIIEEPTICPACGSSDLGVFTADVEDAADLVECENCKWIAPLSEDGVESLRAASAAPSMGHDGSEPSRPRFEDGLGWRS